jgi:hypothetical protein
MLRFVNDRDPAFKTGRDFGGRGAPTFHIDIPLIAGSGFALCAAPNFQLLTGAVGRLSAIDQGGTARTDTRAASKRAGVERLDVGGLSGVQSHQRKSDSDAFICKARKRRGR